MPKCGNCQEIHPTSREVRECYDPFVGLATDPEFKPAQERQKDAYSETFGTPYANTAENTTLLPWLRKQTWSDFAMSLVSYADKHGGLTAKQAASARSMKAKVENKPADGDQQKLRKVEDQVEAGRYAIESDGKTMFYKVDKPEEGRWAGRTFVKVQASDDFWPIKDPTGRLRILSAIAVDPEAAMMRYGQELGACGRCGRTLTDETSRDLGIGPVCRGDQ